MAHGAQDGVALAMADLPHRLFLCTQKDASCGRMQSRRFIQQALDPDYGHPAFETMFVAPVLGLTEIT